MCRLDCRHRGDKWFAEQRQTSSGFAQTAEQVIGFLGVFASRQQDPR